MDVVPGDVMSSSKGVMSRSRFHSACSFVDGVLKSVASLVFFHSVEERAVGLSVVLGRAVKTADFVDCVRCLRGRRGGLGLGEDVP